MHHFTASDGARIAYRDEGAGRPLVLLHGLMAHGGFFPGQAPLAANFRIVSIDLRGHGASPAPEGSAGVERIAADVAELSEAIGIEGAIGIGWSLGATVLWHVLAGPAGHRFSGAVIVDMTARVLNGGGWTLGLSQQVCEARTTAIRDDFENFAANAGQAIFAEPDGEMRELAEWASIEFARNDPTAIGRVWKSLMEQDVRPLLKRIEHPTLIIHGDRSSLYGADTADHLVEALPNARAVRFERSGHAPHLEQPELFNRVVTEFAAELPRVPEQKISI